jgi:adenosylcobinamide-GDP ribazoletransferase
MSAVVSEIVPRLVQELRLFFVALQFFTRVPVPAWVGFTPEWLNRSARYFPAVGLCVGAVAAGVFRAAEGLFPTAVAAGLSMSATLLLTGGFHEDGLADTCDGLGGAVDRERALAIMKDSRIGSYGALGLLMVLGLKAATLTALPSPLAVPALLLGHCASRAAAVGVMACLAYAGDAEHAKAKPLVQRIATTDAALALAWPGAAAVALAAWQPAWIAAIATGLALVVAITLSAVRWLRRRIGGYTGDTLGAVQQVAELLLLLGWLAAARWV